MPTYEYLCEKCKKNFTIIQSIREYEKKKVKCPNCSGTKAKQQITPFQTKTSRKS